jgi:hypothetical protein
LKASARFSFYLGYTCVVTSFHSFARTIMDSKMEEEGKLLRIWTSFDLFIYIFTIKFRCSGNNYFFGPRGTQNHILINKKFLDFSEMTLYKLTFHLDVINSVYSLEIMKKKIVLLKVASISYRHFTPRLLKFSTYNHSACMFWFRLSISLLPLPFALWPVD